MGDASVRNHRFTQLRPIIHGGTQLLQRTSSLRMGNASQVKKDADDWRGRALATLTALSISQEWCTWPEQQYFSELSVDQAINGLQILSWRILDGRSESLSGDERNKIEVATRLLTFGMHLVEYAMEHRDGVLFNIGRAFTSFQDETLPAALVDLHRWNLPIFNQDSPWEKSLQFVDNYFNAGTNILALDKNVLWHFGWSLFTLGWQLTESLGDSISLGNNRCCTFDQAKLSRIEHIQRHNIICPHCDIEVDFALVPSEETLGQASPRSCFWDCRTCLLGGCFPLNARPDSAWHVPRQQQWELLRRSSATQEGEVKLIVAGRVQHDDANGRSEPSSGQPSSHSKRNLPMSPIKLFISHSAKDVGLAKAFVDCVEACIEVPDNGLRCTSVPGYKLAPGDVSDEVLRDNLEQCSIVIGLLTDESLKSGYVIMELGAAWGLNKTTCAILAPGIEFKHVPGPLARRHAVMANSDHDIADVMDVIAGKTGWPQRNRAKSTAAVSTFVRLSDETRRLLPASGNYRVVIMKTGKQAELLKLTLDGHEMKVRSDHGGWTSQGTLSDNRYLGRFKFDRGDNPKDGGVHDMRWDGHQFIGSVRFDDRNGTTDALAWRLETP